QAVAGFDKNDITTWDLKAIFKQVLKNYQSSLENKDSLKRTPLNIYDDVLTNEQPASRKFRPTLYDFLAHRAIDFYMNEEPDLLRPAYKFELDNANVFDNSNDFIKIKFESTDSLSLKFYAIKTLQDLIAFHMKDQNPQALIDAELKRLKFVRTKSVLETKDSLYLIALQDLEKQYTSNPASSEVNYEIAVFYLEKGNKYNSQQSEGLLEETTAKSDKWLKKQALEICEATIKKYPDSDGATNCNVLKAQIKQQALEFKTEKINIPDRPFRALLSYKNLKQVYVRVAKMDAISLENQPIDHYYGEKLIKEYLKLNPVKEWTVELPDDGDYHSHSTEIKIPELPFGYYVILVGSEKTFSYKNNGVAYTTAWVSNISYVNRRMPDGSYDFFVQHRETGAPLKGLSAQLYFEKYDEVTRRNNYVKAEKYISDEKGYFNVSAVNDYRSFAVDFTLPPKELEGRVSDRLQTDNSIYQYRLNASEKEKITRTFFFLDRGIYRPGQTVYFKGIMISTDGETNEIMPKTATKVTLFDVNQQKVADVDLTTNEYGTFNGSFTTPSGVLNGEMSLTNENSTISFSVEEYKRPKFEVTFNPVMGSYRLNENIKVNGVAQAYSGAKIDGAAVKYRVIRNASFRNWYYWKGNYPTSGTMEITNGITSTNDTGAFFVDFKAIPDLSIPKSYAPNYSFTVFADVTDINGETHSSQTNVNVAYTALNLSIDIPEMLEIESKKSVGISTTNMSGQFEKAEGKVEIYKLKEPEQTYRKRLWDQPDKYIMSETEFKKAFPNDEYKDENNMYKWLRGEKVYEKLFKNESIKNTASKSIEIIDSVKITNLKSWKQGVYVMEAHSKDIYGEDVKEIKYFTVYSAKGKDAPSNKIEWFNNLNDTPLEPGTKAQLLIGSKEENVNVLYEIEYKNAIIKKDFILLNKQQKIIEIPIEEKHRGNFVVHFLFVKNNRIYRKDIIVNVPYTNKELDISFETFRNKLLPGEKEEWKIKLRDKKGDKVAAEMVATMYDASLDAFRPNAWSQNFGIYTNYYSKMFWEDNNGFGIITAQLYAIDWDKYPVGVYHIYDRLNWFGYG
ncbi:MAG: hypothetical protein H0W84_08970, partial [Bacteroidetes bacterium]|nr:hypothetical protein [Bacteroidota bacterium]